MKKFLLAALAVSLLVISGCSSLPSSLVSGAIGAGQSLKAVPLVAGAVDFKSGEVLCSDGIEKDAENMSYYVGTIMTQPTPATKNQAEALFVGSGQKAWASFVIPSHKAQTAELAIGKLVFVLAGWSDQDAKNVDAMQYRKGRWDLVRITSVDELFKKRVEVNGYKFHPDLIRIADIPLE